MFGEEASRGIALGLWRAGLTGNQPYGSWSRNAICCRAGQPGSESKAQNVNKPEKLSPNT